MKILVIDGQSGRLGAQVIEGLRKALPECLYTITAVGANALATSAMLRAGADQAATGENAVIVQCRTAELIVGPVGIAIADALLGEITPAMAAAVGQAQAERILLPSHQCGSMIIGTSPMTRQQLVDEAVREICTRIELPF